MRYRRRLIWLSDSERKVLTALLGSEIAAEAQGPGTWAPDDLAVIRKLLRRILGQPA